MTVDGPSPQTTHQAPVLHEGEFDPWYHTLVKSIILQDDQAFAVWMVDNKEAEVDDVWWRTERDLHEFPPGTSDVITRTAHLEAVRISSLDRELRDTYRALLGNAIARALDQDVPGANATLSYAGEFVQARLQEKTRGWYLQIALGGVCVGVAVMGFAYALLCGTALSCRSATAVPLYCIGMGILGASVSIISRTGSFSVDPSAGRSLHTLEAICRVLIGAIAGFVVLLAMKAKVVQFSDSGSSFGPMLAGFAAGYSERLIKSLGTSLDGLLGPKDRSEQPPQGPNPPPPPGGAGGAPSGSGTKGEAPQTKPGATAPPREGQHDG